MPPGDRGFIFMLSKLNSNVFPLRIGLDNYPQAGGGAYIQNEVIQDDKYP